MKRNCDYCNKFKLVKWISRRGKPSNLLDKSIWYGYEAYCSKNCAYKSTKLMLSGYSPDEILIISASTGKILSRQQIKQKYITREEGEIIFKKQGYL